MIKLFRFVTILSCAALVAVRGQDIRFASGKSAPCVPFETSNRHIGFQAKLNDRDGFRLVLDTGAGGNVLDAQRADELGLEKVGRQQSRGSGGLETGSTVHGVDVGLPGLTLVDLTMGTLSLGAISAQSGRPMDAILGYPVLSKLIVEVDYPKSCVSFFDPDGYRYEGSGVSVPLTFKQNLPYVKAEVALPDGRSIAGKFVLDTGASTALILTSETIEREAVSGSLGKTMSVLSRGVGGATETKLARVGKLTLGGFSLASPVTALQPPGPGRISAEGTIGNIGGGVLSRFKVIFDYPHKRVIFEPGPELDKPFEADMSGLTLVTAPPDYRRMTVVRVLEASPAVEAGIQAGDEIETIDGKPAEEIGLTALRERLRLDGQDLKLGLRRGDDRLTVAMKTRRLI